ncbi:MBL fold metallo-hydrolase [Streptomyces sp. NPDC005722]
MAGPVTWTAGDMVVHRVDETTLPPGTGRRLLPAATPQVVAGTPWLRDFAAADGTLRLATHTFAVVAGGLRVLVDTGIGNGKTRADPAWDRLATDYPRRLAEAGFPPHSVDLVILTHLHTDHVGWNTRDDEGTWVPAFPHARHLVSRAEWEHWSGADLDEDHRQVFRDSVLPVRDAGLLDLAEVTAGPLEAAPGIRLLPVPGHTPGQVAVELRGGGRAALVTGDSFHHPVQIAHPGITSTADTDPALAVRTRRALLGALAGTDTLLLGTHFPPPTAGTVVTWEDGHRLLPEPPAT